MGREVRDTVQTLGKDQAKLDYLSGIWSKAREISFKAKFVSEYKQQLEDENEPLLGADPEKILTLEAQVRLLEGLLFTALKATVALKGGDSGFTKAVNNYARVRDLVDDISGRLKRRAKPLDIPPDDRKYVKDLDDAGRKKGEWLIKIMEASRLEQ